MTTELTTRQLWVVMEGDVGTTAIPLDELPFSVNQIQHMHKRRNYTRLLEDYPGLEIDFVRVVKAYGVRCHDRRQFMTSPWSLYKEKGVALMDAQL